MVFPTACGRYRRIQNFGAFTLIELLVVLAIVALLLTVATPRYFGALKHAKEVSLQESLHVMRQSLDDFHADKGRYPTALHELVAAKYLRDVPVDPITESKHTWQFVIAPAGGFANVMSGAAGVDSEGVAYASY